MALIRRPVTAPPQESDVPQTVSLFRQRVGSLLTSTWPYWIIVLTATVLRWPTLNNNILSIDEPDYFAQTARLDTPLAWIYAFYFRAEVKSQVGLFPYWLSEGFGAQNAILARHIFGLATVIAIGWLMVILTRQVLNRAWPGLVATLLWLPYTVVGPGYAFAGHTTLEYFPAPKLEYFQTPFLLLALVLFLKALNRGQSARARGWTMAGAGLAWALSVLIKPSSLLLGPYLVLLIPALLSRQEGGRAWARQIVRLESAFILAAGLLIGLVFVPYLFSLPALAELLFNLTQTAVDYNQASTSDLITRVLAMFITAIPPALLIMLGLVPVLSRRYLGGNLPAEVPAAALVTGGSAAGLFVVSLAGCVCPHYFPPVVALLNLTIILYLAPVLERLATHGQRRTAWIAGLVLAGTSLVPQVPAMLAFPAQAGQDLYRADDVRRFDLDGLLAYIETHTQPTDSIWVYYNTSEIYLWSARKPATRDPQSNWMTTAWSDPWFERTVQDLDDERPALVIGINKPLLPRRPAKPMDQIPQVSTWINQHYHCDSALIRGAVVCTLNLDP